MDEPDIALLRRLSNGLNSLYPQWERDEIVSELWLWWSMNDHRLDNAIGFMVAKRRGVLWESYYSQWRGCSSRTARRRRADGKPERREVPLSQIAPKHDKIGERWAEEFGVTWTNPTIITESQWVKDVCGGGARMCDAAQLLARGLTKKQTAKSLDVHLSRVTRLVSDLRRASLLENE